MLVYLDQVCIPFYSICYRGALPLTHPLVADHPLFVADHPLVVADHPLVVADHPLVVADHPLVVADHPLVVADHPLVVVDHPLVVVVRVRHCLTSSAFHKSQQIIAYSKCKSLALASWST
jgi:hypothetical protein